MVPRRSARAKSTGTKIFALSGNIQHPGLIEAPMGTTLRQLIEMAGGMRPGRTFKAAQPGGVSSAPIGTADLDVQMALETLHQIDALLGSGGIVVFDDSVCMVDMTRYIVNFSELESCSRCTACRVGSMRLTDILSRISDGRGSDGGLRHAGLAEEANGADDALRARPGGGDAGVRRGEGIPGGVRGTHQGKALSGWRL